MAPNNLLDFISESRHIIRANPRHFFTLSLIFLFTLSFSILLFSNLFNNFLTKPQQTTNAPSLLYSLFAMILSNCGVISITYSVFNFFYGQPVNLQSAIKSIFNSFLPLLATTIVSQVIFFFILFFYGLLLALLIGVAALFDVTVSYSSPYFIAFFAALPLLLVLMYLQVIWTLVPVIVVVESCWGLEPLRRSTRLVKGMKGVALSSFFFHGFFSGIFVWSCLFVTRGYDGITENWVTVVRIWVIIVMNSSFIAMVMLSKIAVTTVMYIYCKANHGDIVEEFVKEYASLPFHDGNVSQTV